MSKVHGREILFMKYNIVGQRELKGKITINGNKNAVLPCLAAILLTEEEVILHNVPLLEDVKVMIKVLEYLGVNVSRDEQNPRTFRFKASSLKTTEIPVELASKIRASILFLGPMLARAGSVVLYPPGGDVIGRRRLDTHFHSLKKLGVKFNLNGTISGQAKKLVGANIFQDEASVTATENTIMAASMADGITVIENAACEPHIQDLCHMIVSMGVSIEGIGSNILTIHGQKKLHGTEFSIGPDFMEVGSMIGLAAVTRSEIEIVGAKRKDLRMCEIAFGKLGITWKYDGDNILVPKKQKYKVIPDIGNAIPSIADAPWPGFPPDLTSIVVVVATQAHGTVIVHEKMFESRMFFVDKLVNMGARIILCDPHRAVINGPSDLIGSHLSSPDVRAGMAMVIAALGAKGESIIQNVYEIERGYENLATRLASLGANIKRVEL